MPPSTSTTSVATRHAQTVPDLAVLPGNRLRWEVPGLSLPAPGTREEALRWCDRWAQEVGWRLVADVAAADAAVVGADITSAVPPGFGGPVAIVEAGQGIDGLHWAIRSVACRAQWPLDTVRYGDHPEQVADVRHPQGDVAGVAMLLHGGFWYRAWRRDLMDGVALDLTRRGWVTWNVEYRRIGAGGGWPATGEDVVVALDRLAGTQTVTLVGHSAGGQLALWAARQRRTAVRQVVALAPLCDLAAARDDNLGDGAVHRLLGGAEVSPADPSQHLPLGVPALLAHATADPVVPVSQSRTYVAAARDRGEAPELVEVDGSDHLSLVDPAQHWPQVAERMTRGCG